MNFKAIEDDCWEQFGKFPESADEELMCACLLGKVRWVRTLLEVGVSPNIRDPRNWRTPLHYAVLSNNPMTVYLLLSKGANPGPKDIFSLRPVDLPCSEATEQAVSVAKEIRAKKPPPPPPPGPTAEELRKAALKKKLKIFDAKRKEQEIKKKDRDFNDMVVAVRTHAVPEVDRLLHNGVSVNRYLENGSTLLIEAILHRDEEIVTLLLQRGAKGDMPDSKGRSPLQVARKMKQKVIITSIEMWLKQNLRVASRVRGIRIIARTSAYVAIAWDPPETSNSPIKEYRVMLNFDQRPSQWLSTGTNTYIVLRGLKVGAQTEVQIAAKNASAWNDWSIPFSVQIETPEALAFRQKREKDKIAARKQAEKDRVYKEERDAIVRRMMDAASSGDIETLKDLTDMEQALVNCTTEGGGTPLHAAAACGNLDSIDFLVNAGANLEAQNKGKQNPKECAEVHRHKKAVELLTMYRKKYAFVYDDLIEDPDDDIALGIM